MTQGDYTKNLRLYALGPAQSEQQRQNAGAEATVGLSSSLGADFTYGGLMLTLGLGPDQSERGPVQP